mmetsp:Transcript_20598/g.38340  ORF Transcript_20598/g.38340 Transcript_20598/m.38340 type:complete len:168 (-) Transcript_20598:35-538(-)
MFTRVQRAVADLGLSEEMLARSLAVGIVFGMCPVYVPTLPSVLMPVIASVCGLSGGAAFLGLQLATPFLLISMVPFIRIGEKLLGMDVLALDGMVDALQTDTVQAFKTFGTRLGAGALTWILCSPILVGLFYMALLPLCRQLLANQEKSEPSSESKRASKRASKKIK